MNLPEHEPGKDPGIIVPARSGAGRIAAERRRQVEEEDWTPEHDDEHTKGELLMAAICYAAKAAGTPVYVREMVRGGHAYVDPWPWESCWDKRHGHKGTATLVRMLEKAGALIAAEIDRLQRDGRKR